MTEARRNRRWRLLFAAPRTGAENMARDVALLTRARETGETVLAVYAWNRPTLSLGRNQRARGRYDLDLMHALQIDIVRRPTGGRALLHHREVTYSVTAPIDAAGSLRDSYERINALLLNGLSRLGVSVSEAAPRERAPAPTDTPCFAIPSRGELVTDGRKLVGSAQWREEGALLQHGSILIDDDQSMIPLLASETGDRDPIPSPATLTAALGRAPLTREVADALFDAVLEMEDASATALDEDEVRADAIARIPFFENELWTWRR